MHLDRRLLGLARHIATPLAGALVLSLLGAAATVVMAMLLAHLLAEVHLLGPAALSLTPVLLGLTVAAVVRAASRGWAEKLMLGLALPIKALLRQRLFNKLCQLGPYHSASFGPGRWLTLVTQGIEGLDPWFCRYLPQWLLAATLPLLFIGVATAYDLLSGVILLVTAPLIPFFMVLIGRAAARASQRQWRALGRLGAVFHDRLRGLESLRVLGAVERTLDTIATTGESHRSRTMGVLRIAFASALALELLANLSVAIVAVEIGIRLLYGALPFESAMVVLLLAPEVYAPLRLLGTHFHGGTAGQAAAAEAFTLLAATPDGAACPEATPALAPASPFPVVLRQVSFAFPAPSAPADLGAAAAPLVLDGLDLEVRRGECVVVLGPSGAGKSTLLALLLGLLRPSRGEILAGGLGLSQWPTERWRARVAWVPQRPHIFNATVAENLCLGGAPRDAATLEAVVTQVGLAEVVAALPRGLDTPLGDDGWRLSAGQGQRLALARALLRDADLLLLDEATAHLDAESEATVAECIAAWRRRGAVILVAHRLSAVRCADRVWILEEGRVVEEGSVAALRHRGGRVRDLWEAWERHEAEEAT